MSICPQNDQSVLSQYNEHTHVLALRDDQIILLDRSLCTVWNRLKSAFGSGPLAGAHVKLTEVAQYLSQYNWKPQNEGYRTACILANKALLHKNDKDLFEKVANTHVSKKLYISRDLGAHILYFSLNPHMQVKHLLCLIRAQARHSISSSSQIAVCCTATTSEQNDSRFRIVSAFDLFRDGRHQPLKVQHVNAFLNLQRLDRTELHVL